MDGGVGVSLSGGVGVSLGAGAGVGCVGTGAGAAPSREENGLSMSPFEGWKKKNSGAGGSSGTVGSPACLAAILAAALAAIFSLPAAILSWRVSVLSSRCVPCGCAWMVKRGEIGDGRGRHSERHRSLPQAPTRRRHSFRVQEAALSKQRRF